MDPALFFKSYQLLQTYSATFDTVYAQFTFVVSVNDDERQIKGFSASMET